jgi:hypothetical protein
VKFPASNREEWEPRTLRRVASEVDYTRRAECGRTWTRQSAANLDSTVPLALKGEGWVREPWGIWEISWQYLLQGRSCLFTYPTVSLSTSNGAEMGKKHAACKPAPLRTPERLLFSHCRTLPTAVSGSPTFADQLTRRWPSAAGAAPVLLRALYTLILHGELPKMKWVTVDVSNVLPAPLSAVWQKVSRFEDIGDDNLLRASWQVRRLLVLRLYIESSFHTLLHSRIYDLAPSWWVRIEPVVEKYGFEATSSAEAPQMSLLIFET